ncbi:unnamed protein product [marine sediment metagenome]|uniref:Uncharacterized protein n=1 Tax=marine sediment metagenome TaxID=412755 RepID=X1FES2_9ZZZZ
MPILSESLFGLTKIEFYLRPDQGDWVTPPETGFIALHRATNIWKPIDPPILQVNFATNLLPFPQWQLQTVNLGHTFIKGFWEYAWVLGFPGAADGTSYIQTRRGYDGTCNLDPLNQTYVSYFTYGVWQPWEEWPLLQEAYYMNR